nr:hypothetical protein [uncultured Flavobacterium sp.]
MRKSIIFKLFFVSVIVCYFYNSFFSRDMLVGTYVVKNYYNSPSAVELPSTTDTLKILKDNKFISSDWGEGKYNLSYSITGTKIHFSYQYEFGTAGFTSSLTRKLFIGNTKIMLNYDSGVYYEKMD